MASAQFYFVSSVLEHINSSYGFGWVNYARVEEELGSIVGEILGYKFKEERKVFKEGPVTTACLEHESWKKRCVKLLKTFFSRDGQFSGIITFPETSITAEGKPWQSVMSTLKNWCKNSYSANLEHDKGDATGLIIRNYDLKNHLEFCKVTDIERKRCLPLLFKDFENKFKLNRNYQRFLVFNPSENVILVIRMADAQQSGELNNEAYLCIDEIKIVSFLLRDELKNSGVMVAGLVTYSGENTHSQNGCKNCNDFIVSCEIFNSVEKFDKFWKTFVKKSLSEGFAELLVSEEKISTRKNVFQAVGSKILGYLAHLQFKMKTFEKPVLPVTQNNPSGNIKQAELLLDRYQMEIAYSNEQRILLDGNYGTGKTVVALKKAELLHKNLNEKEVIYYVTFPGKSRLDCWIKQNFKNYEKIRVLRGGSSLSNIVTNEILSKEEKSDTKKIHLIVDEYNLQYLSSSEWENLHEIFTKKEQFKNSSLLIALQPIKIDRADHVHFDGKIRKFFQNNVLNKLENFMRKYNLTYVMRTTVQINNLVKITQSYLSKKSNLYIYPYNFQSNITSGDPSNPNADNVLIESQELTDDSKSYALASKENTCKFSSRNSSPQSSYSVNSVSRDSSNPGVEFAPIESKEITHVEELMSTEINPRFSSQKFTPELSSLSVETIDYDKCCKSAPTSRQRNNRNLQRTTSKYSYTCNSEIGHGIGGSLPQLIELKPRNLKEQIALIAFFLTRVSTSKRIAIIHFEPNEALWLQKLFQLKIFQSFTMTNDVEEFLNSSAEIVLVTSYDIVKGLEFSEVLLILENNEYYERHYIPEAIARCRSKLYILIKSPWGKNEQSNTGKDLVRHWKKVNDAKISKQENPVLEILTLGFCSNSPCSILYEDADKFKPCSLSKKNSTFYGVHKHTKFYIEFSKEIEKIIVPNLQMHDEKKDGKTATL